MSILLPNFVGNLKEGIVIVFFEYKSVKENLIKDKCLSCNEDYEKSS